MTNALHRNADFGAMEFFILALIGKAGLTSLYEFQQRAGLQPGGIRPALQRLESAGLITRGELSRRRRRALALTEEGHLFLCERWPECLFPHPDIESDLRAACVALLMGDQKAAAQFLIGMQKIRQFFAEEKTMEAERLEKTQRDPLSTYAWMRALTEAQRHSAESKAFGALSQYLKEKHQPDVERQR